MSVSFNSAPILLTDEQMRQYIVDGYVMLEPSVPDELHETVRRKLADVLEVGSNPGNNVLPRVPEMRHILNSPEVRGALISALGEGYIEHPHRYCHHLGPVTDPDPEPEIKVAANCHQDSYTPLGRPRQHYSRFARIMYYPQDTPIELGPTHAIPGTQYHKRLTDEDRAQAIPMVGKAGTVSLTHFDVGHAAGVNLLNQPRDMIKFIYVRASEPTAPSWDCQNLQWQNLAAIETPHNLELVWSHMWDWLCGKRDRYESFRSNGIQSTTNHLYQYIAALEEDQNLADRLRAIYDLAGLGSHAAEAVPTLISMLDKDHQAARAAAIYTLGAIGEPAVAPLMERLEAAGRREDAHPIPEPWNEGAISMEDAAHALTAIGSPAVPALTEALESSSEWVRINASFALGELDSHAASAVSRLTARLSDDSHRVVRTATDALGSIHQGAPTFIPRISRLLIEDLADWHEEERRGWTIQDQVRTNAAMAFTRLGKDAVGAEEVLFHAMDDPCGHVGAFAMDALRRIDSPAARQAVMAYLEAQRWDESITSDRQF
jgi:HEAT repeat protein